MYEGMDATTAGYYQRMEARRAKRKARRTKIKATVKQGRVNLGNTLKSEVQKTTGAAKGRLTMSFQKIGEKARAGVTEGGKGIRSAIHTLAAAPEDEAIEALEGLTDQELGYVEGLVAEELGEDSAGLEDEDEEVGLFGMGPGLGLLLAATPRGRLKQIQLMERRIEKLQDKGEEKNAHRIQRLESRIDQVKERLEKQVERRQSRGRSVNQEVLDYLEDQGSVGSLLPVVRPPGRTEGTAPWLEHDMGRGSWGDLGIDAAPNYLSDNSWTPGPVHPYKGRIIIGAMEPADLDRNLQSIRDQFLQYVKSKFPSHIQTAYVNPDNPAVVVVVPSETADPRLVDVLMRKAHTMASQSTPPANVLGSVRDVMLEGGAQTAVFFTWMAA